MPRKTTAPAQTIDTRNASSDIAVVEPDQGPDLSLWATPDPLPVTAYAAGTGGGATFTVDIGILHRVFPVVPDTIQAAHAAIRKVEAARDEHFGGSWTDAEAFKNPHVDHLLAGGELGEDFPALVRDFIWAQRDREAAQDLTERIRLAISYRLPTVYAEAVPAMLDGLRADLDELLERGRRVSQVLGGLDVTDVQAVATGTEEQRATLAELPDMVRRYWQIRAAQKVLYVASGEPAPGNSANSSRWTWREYFAQMQHWELSAGTFDLGPDRGPEAARRFLIVASAVSAKGDSVVWLPTVKQLREKYEEHWNAEAPAGLPVPAVPNLLPGQWIEQSWPKGGGVVG